MKKETEVIFNHNFCLLLFLLNLRKFKFYFFFGLRRAHPSSEKSGSSPTSLMSGLSMNWRQSS